MGNELNLVAIRGATTVENDNENEIDRAVKELYETLIQENKINENEMIYIMFSQTSDLQSKNPAAALRKAGYGSNTALFCSQEPEVKNMLKKAIRIMILTKTDQNKIKPVYLKGAKILRPEYAK